jgi:hypothetical protein
VEHNINNNNQPWGRKGDFAVHASVYGKVQAEPDVKPNDQERRKGRERCLLVAQAGLASYLCRLCTFLCTPVRSRRGDIHPTTIVQLYEIRKSLGYGRARTSMPRCYIQVSAVVREKWTLGPRHRRDLMI